MVRRMASLTDDADYDGGETFENVPITLSDVGNHDNYYGRRLRTRRRDSSSDGVHHVMDCQTAALHRGLAIVFWRDQHTNLCFKQFHTK
ncbi:unnamed protein product [Protopolystoma xenopodis]|uniref:Uncharacterized protein n=1 Tax=Protopolystoma xenopodis TaxID=117903 RepID=A0A448XIY2_9PLAT|nr:unnamed protein product [Protopolystoma xenopodis]